MDFAAMAELCAPGVAAGTLKSIASVESGFNPYAIGVVGARLQRQPRTLPEALATANKLETLGYNYSVGVVQVNRKNFGRFGLTPEQAFEPCANIRVGAFIFQDCARRAGDSTDALGAALSCYNSGNFSTGYRLGYVAKVKAAGAGTMSIAAVQPIPVVTSARRSSPSRLRRRAAAALFVTAAANPAAHAIAASGDTFSPPKSKDTALLF